MTGLQYFLTTIKNIHNWFDDGQQEFKQLQGKALDEYPEKYHQTLDSLSCFEVQNHLIQSYDEIKKKRAIYDDILLRLEKAK